MPYLFVINGRENTYQVLEVQDIVNIGRDEVNDLTLDSPDVSRLHASILQEQGSTYRLVDQNSTNGIEVNGYRVSQHRLQHGDTFAISSYSFTFLHSKPDLSASTMLERTIPSVDDTDSTVVLDRGALWQRVPEEWKTPNGKHLKPGSLLRQVRRGSNISIREASDQTKISASNLQAIESENYADLPVDTYLRPYLVAYAEFLGLDGQKLATDYIQERDRKLTDQQRGCGNKLSVHSGPSSDKPVLSRSRFRISMLFILMLLSCFLFFSYNLDL